MQLLQKTLGKARVTFSLLLVFIFLIKWGGVFGVGLNVFLSLFWSLQKPVLPLPPNSLRQFKNCVAADWEIGNKNCVPADFWQWKTTTLPIQEIGSENCVAADSGNQQHNCGFKNRQRKLCRCRFWKSTAKTASLPIQKSTAMVESSIPYIYIYIYIFFWVFTPAQM